MERMRIWQQSEDPMVKSNHLADLGVARRGKYVKMAMFE